MIATNVCSCPRANEKREASLRSDEDARNSEPSAVASQAMRQQVSVGQMDLA
jgi:hypothetical protein